MKGKRFRSKKWAYKMRAQIMRTQKCGSKNMGLNKCGPKNVGTAKCGPKYWVKE